MLIKSSPTGDNYWKIFKISLWQKVQRRLLYSSFYFSIFAVFYPLKIFIFYDSLCCNFLMRFDATSFRAAFRTLLNIYERAFGKISLLYFNHYLFRKKSVLYIYIYIYIKCKCIYIYIYIYIKCKCIYIYIYIYLTGSRMRFWVHLFKGSKENNIILNKFLYQV